MNKIGFISTGNNLTMIVYKNQKDRANPYYVYSERTIWKDRGDGLEQPHKSRDWKSSTPTSRPAHTT